jgi:hypothetical protein
MTPTKLAFLNTYIDQAIEPDIGSDIMKDRNKVNTVTFLYGYTHKRINNLFTNMNININRRNPSEISDCLTFSDCIILFHNFIEYDNGMQDIIDVCLENNISIVIFSEHIKHGFLTNNNQDLVITRKFPKIARNDKIIKLYNFNFTPYKYIYNTTIKQVAELTRHSYAEINQDRLDKRSKLLQ